VGSGSEDHSHLTQDPEEGDPSRDGGDFRCPSLSLISSVELGEAPLSSWKMFLDGYLKRGYPSQPAGLYALLNHASVTGTSTSGQVF